MLQADIIAKKEADLTKAAKVFEKAGFDPEASREYARQGIDPRIFRKPEKETTHLRIQCVNGNKHGFARCGRVFTSEAVYEPIEDFAPDELHELLGPHLKGTLAVEQFKKGARILEQTAEQAEPEIPMEGLSKPALLAIAKATGVNPGRLGKPKLIERLKAEVDEAKLAKLVAEREADAK